MVECLRAAIWRYCCIDEISSNGSRSSCLAQSFFPSNLSYFGATDTMVRLEAMSCSDHEERQAITAHLR